jgi:predicted enzyme related to lactoylglutathione lyase
MPRIPIQPPDMKDQRPRYTHGWRVDNTIYVAGQLPYDKDGQLVGPNDIHAQARRVLQNIQRIVETGGGAGGINGGIMKPERAGPWPGNMLLYIAVDDLAAYREQIVAAGGKILVEEQEVPGMGAFSLFSDPEGRMMGLWKSRS